MWHPGTDRGNFQGPDEGADHFPGAPDYPRYVGDSNCAVIKAVGGAVKHFAIGERIVTRWPHQSDFVFDERSAAPPSIPANPAPRPPPAAVNGAEAADSTQNRWPIG